MKHQHSRFELLILSVAAALLVNGCSTSESGQGAAPSLKRTQFSVEYPMNSYRTATAAGRLTPEEEQQVNTAYAKYRSAFVAAVDGSQSDYCAATPAYVRILADQVIADLDALSL
jgi:hypothetical protein